MSLRFQSAFRKLNLASSAFISQILWTTQTIGKVFLQEAALNWRKPVSVSLFLLKGAVHFDLQFMLSSVNPPASAAQRPRSDLAKSGSTVC